MLTEINRNKAILAILLLAAAAALISGTVFSTGLVQALLFGSMAVSAAVLAIFVVVALN
jgi:hypothetical protein